MVEIGIVSVCGNTMVISTIAKLRYKFWKEPNRTTRISTIAKWEIWFRENHGTSRVLLYVSISVL